MAKVRSRRRCITTASSTPLAFSGILSCFDATTGELEWRNSKDFKATWPQFGTSMSPVAGDGPIVALIGTNDDGAIVAYEAE
jgi:outer membrane protein assembly factor BamB